jgi:hypothetical protein
MLRTNAGAWCALRIAVLKKRIKWAKIYQTGANGIRQRLRAISAVNVGGRNRCGCGMTPTGAAMWRAWSGTGQTAGDLEFNEGRASGAEDNNGGGFAGGDGGNGRKSGFMKPARGAYVFICVVLGAAIGVVLYVYGVSAVGRNAAKRALERCNRRTEEAAATAPEGGWADGEAPR